MGSTREACDAQRPEAKGKSTNSPLSHVPPDNMHSSASGACGTRTSYVLPNVPTHSPEILRNFSLNVSRCMPSSRAAATLLPSAAARTSGNNLDSAASRNRW